MNLQMHESQFMLDGNDIHLHEALLVAESLVGVITEQIERVQRGW